MSPIDHTYDPVQLDITDHGDQTPKYREQCKTCGLPEIAHGQLAPHPDDDRLKQAEVKAATTLASLARRASRALREHRRIDAVVYLTQLEVTVDNLRKGMHVAINDQMQATKGQANGSD